MVKKGQSPLMGLAPLGFIRHRNFFSFWRDALISLLAPAAAPPPQSSSQPHLRAHGSQQLPAAPSSSSGSQQLPAADLFPAVEEQRQHSASRTTTALVPVPVLFPSLQYRDCCTAPFTSLKQTVLVAFHPHRTLPSMNQGQVAAVIRSESTW